MKKNTSTPYRTFGFEKIQAPKPISKESHKSNVIKGNGDLRIGGKSK